MIEIKDIKCKECRKFIIFLRTIVEEGKETGHLCPNCFRKVLDEKYPKKDKSP